jgi:phenylacetate-coenzyme A ligase PaaK-like adenylate-forming protein
MLKSAFKSILKPVYYRLPARFSNGPLYGPTLRLLEESETWNEDRLLGYQLSKLRVMLRHCAEHVPYYRDLFRQIGFDPASVRELSDLHAIPLLDRDTIRSRQADLIAENIDRRRMLYFTTGGTMGKPLGLYNLRHSGSREWAFIHTLWKRVGFQPGNRRAVLMGWSVHNKRHWRYDPAERAFLFSNFHMTPENVAEYASVMRKRKIPYLHAYPSAAIDFARNLEGLGIEAPTFRTILAASENLYPGQREFIESFFRARLFSWYGHSENTILAGECETSTCYHIFPEYGLAEVVKEDGVPAVHEGEMGELVGTSLDNFAMPLIRYRTDDWAAIGPKRCDCGREYKLIRNTHGRRHQEMLVGKLDNLISITALNMHTDVFDNVQQMQFYQREKGKVELRLRRKPGYSEQDSKRIMASLDEKMGDTMEVTLTFPDDIPLMPRGKFRFVIRDFELPRPANEDRVEPSIR